VDEPCEIGEGTKIWHFSHVMKNCRIGRHCSIGQNVNVAPGVVIGDGVKIQNNVSIYEGVTLEDHVFCGPSMVFTNVVNPRSEIVRRNEYLPTLVRRGASIGANSTIVCGHTIGEYAFIGAGAVVTKDVPDYALMVGNPARRLGWMCRCGIRLPSGTARLTCGTCGAEYSETDGRLAPSR
jgi:UDP-2-acetamido-3-amino-2,3-dideoxy-glucuronate N-acetyltransferase